MTWLYGKPVNFEVSLWFRDKILNLRISHRLEDVYTDSQFLGSKSTLACSCGKGCALMCAAVVTGISALLPLTGNSASRGCT